LSSAPRTNGKDRVPPKGDPPIVTHEPAPEREIRPIVCLADSQLLFWQVPDREEPWLASIRRLLPDGEVSAAYLGASNGDDPAFYSIFSAAMETMGIDDHRMIRSTFPEEDRAFLKQADLILLAGGDPVRGWRVFEQSGIRDVISRRYFEGALLVGVSAGAVQLGWAAATDAPPADRGTESEKNPEAEEVELTFRLVPAVIGAHEEADDWQNLQRLLRSSALSIRGLGIPSGGGLLYHPDGTVEPVRRPLQEIVIDEGELRQSLLFPGDSVPDEAEASMSAAPTVH